MGVGHGFLRALLPVRINVAMPSEEPAVAEVVDAAAAEGVAAE